MLIPFTHGKYLDLGIFFVPGIFLILLGTVNGANFTDGLDGLASSVTVLIATFFNSSKPLVWEHLETTRDLADFVCDSRLASGISGV